jgi:hypothetical protein
MHGIIFTVLNNKKNKKMKRIFIVLVIAFATSYAVSAQTCGVLTQKGVPCKRHVKVAGQKCYQHKDGLVPVKNEEKKEAAQICGKKTADGTPCRRKGKCPFHGQ